MNVRLADVRDMTGLGTLAALAFCVVMVIVASLLVVLALFVPSPAVILARNASLVFGWAVVLVTMALLAVLFYTQYLLLKAGLER